MQPHPAVLAALAAVPFLFNTGLQVSGYNNSIVTAVCWSLAGLILALAGIEYARKWNVVRREKGVAGLESWYFIIPCFVIAVIAVAGAAYGVGLRSNLPPDVSKKAGSDQKHATVLISNPRVAILEEGNVLISLTGSFVRNGTLARVYVEIGYVNIPNDKPVRRVKVAEVKDFVRGEEARIPIVSYDVEHGPEVVRWGTSAVGASRDIDRFGAGGDKIQVRIVIMDAEDKVQSYCFIMEPKFTVMDVIPVPTPPPPRRLILIQENAFEFKDKWGPP